MQTTSTAFDAGDAPELSKALKPRHVTMITIGGIIGAGLFVGSSVAIAATGPAVILSYALTGLLFMQVMRCLGEMAVGRPEIRSFTDFPRAVIGHWAGFVVGWLYWYFWIIVIPVEAIAGAVIVHEWMPQVPSIVVGTVLVLTMTAVNLMPTRYYGEFEFWFASIKVAAILVFIAGCTAFLLGGFGEHTPVTTLWATHGGVVPLGPVAIITAIPTIFFSMMGAEISTIAAAESPDPARAVARMVSMVVWRILFFYLGSLSLILCIVPWTGITPGVSPFVTALGFLKVHYADTLMAAIILTAVLSCLNSSFYVASRVLFVLAAHGDAPRRLVRLNAKGVPANSVLIGTAAGMLGIIAHEFAPSGVFAFLVNASGSLIVFIYLMICVTQVMSRREFERSGRAVPEPRTWLFPWTSYAAIAGMTLVLIFMAFNKAMSKEVYASAISVAIAFGCFAIRRRRIVRAAKLAPAN